MKISQHVIDIVNLINSNGGKALLVGGAVVDLILDRVPKDWDIEVYHVPVPELEKMLAPYSPARAGAKFGVLKLNANAVDGLDIDVSVPRRDNKVGKAHNEFEASFDIHMDPEQAAQRRDFTINSLALDPTTGEIIDAFDGLRDLSDGVLRVTNPATFVEDPIRPLRAMQLSARKCERIDFNAVELCRGMVDEFKHLSSERIFEEFNKLLLQAEKPSIGLRFLQESGWLKNFPELHAMVPVPHKPEWHPEGGVWEHTLIVVDNAAAYGRDKVPEDWKLAYMYAVLLHDTAKPSMTLWDLTSKGHEQGSEPFVRSFMERLTNQADLIDKVVAITVNHLGPHTLTQGEAKESAWRRLHNKVPLGVIAYMSLADGCAHPDKTPENHVPSKKCLEMLEVLNAGDSKIPPILQGRDLKAAGFKPGPNFKKGLDAAYEAQMEGESDKDKLLQVAAAAM